MHVTRTEIQRWLDKTPADSERAREIEAHLRECRFCADLLEQERAFREELEKLEGGSLPDRLRDLAGSLYQRSLAGRIVYLQPLETEEPERPVRLAADSAGSKSNRPNVESLATLFSEEPEIVLNVIRNNQAGLEYLQLTAEDLAHVSNVLVRAPKADLELVTNSEGRAELPQNFASDPAGLDWQIDLPSATFELQPLEYDPEKPEYTREFELETDSQDKLRVTLERKTEGVQVTVRVLELSGESDFEQVKVVVSHERSLGLGYASADRPAVFTLESSDSALKIRLFQKP